jgi:hypothetical protein
MDENHIPHPLQSDQRKRIQSLRAQSEHEAIRLFAKIGPHFASDRAKLNEVISRSAVLPSAPLELLPAHTLIKCMQAQRRHWPTQAALFAYHRLANTTGAALVGVAEMVKFSLGPHKAADTEDTDGKAWHANLSGFLRSIDFLISNGILDGGPDAGDGVVQTPNGIAWVRRPAGPSDISIVA